MNSINNIRFTLLRNKFQVMHGNNIKFIESIRQEYESIETPCYIFDPEILINNFKQLKQKLGTALILSVKANPCAELLLRSSHITTDGCEVASLQELNLVAGRASGVKYVNNLSMSINLLRAAIGAKATIIIDNLHQVELLKNLKGNYDISALIIRLNSTVLNKFFPEQPTMFRDDHFGTDWDCLPLIISKIHELKIKIKGFHIFRGSNTFINSALPTITAIQKLIPEVESMLGYPVNFFNLGGGFLKDWQESNFDFNDYRKNLKTLPSYVELAHESGRGIFASAGAFLVKIIAIKKLNNHIIAICNGGLAHNFLLCRTENPIRKYQVPTLLKQSHAQNGTISEFPIIYVGTTCSKDDIIAKMPKGSSLPEPGDICIFHNCGAYNSTYNMPKFLGLGEPSIYIGKL